MDNYWTKNSIIEYHSLAIYEFAKFRQIQKCATQAHRIHFIRNTRLELRLLSAAKYRGVNFYALHTPTRHFLSNTNQPSKMPYWTNWTTIGQKLQKKRDVNALHTSHTLIFTPMSKNASSDAKVVIIF